MTEEKKKMTACTRQTDLIYAAFQTMLNYTSDMMFIKDINLVYVAVSQAFVKMVGKECASEIIGKTDLEIFADENLAKRYVSDDRKLLENGKNLIDYMEPITDEGGHARYGSTSKYILYNEDGHYSGILGVTRDITRDYIARRHYQQELNYLFELPADTYAVSYIDVDSWRIISQRRQLINESTFQSCVTVEGLCEAALESIVEKKGKAAEFYRNFSQATLNEIYSSGRTHLSFKYQRYLLDGSMHWVNNHVRFLSDAETGHLCVMLSAVDIDTEKKEEQELLTAATMDKMTMLLNRETTMQKIAQVLERESECKHALYMIDIDNFKILNDTLGHQTGDEFLVAVAKAVRNCFRESDIVGRIGGDEFFVLMRNTPGIEKSREKAEELRKAIERVCSKYAEIALSGSIGISLYPESGRTVEALYAEADSSLYQAKRQGKNRFIFS